MLPTEAPDPDMSVEEDMECLWSISQLNSLIRSFSQAAISLSYAGALIYTEQLNPLLIYDLR